VEARRMTEIRVTITDEDGRVLTSIVENPWCNDEGGLTMRQVIDGLLVAAAVNAATVLTVTCRKAELVGPCPTEPGLAA
jgi:hypothetical protein